MRCVTRGGDSGEGRKCVNRSRAALKAPALQTLTRLSTRRFLAERLDCVRFTGAFSDAGMLRPRDWSRSVRVSLA